MIKIVQFIHGLNMGGAETLVKDYALMLNKEKFDITIICLEHRDSPYEKILKDNGIKIIYICDEMPFYGKADYISRIFNAIMRRVLVKKHLKKCNPDIIHEHLLLNEYIKFARPKKGTVIVYTQHFDVERWQQNYNFEIKCLRWIIQNYKTQLIALNDKMKLQINALLEVSNTIVFNNGVNRKRFQKRKDIQKIRDSLGISKKSFVVGHVGRFNKIKNHKYLIEIFKILLKYNSDAFLLMIGDGDTKTEIENEIERCGIVNKTLILSKRTDVPELLSAMDILVFPSISEGMPVTLIEAQMAGLKCVVSNTISSEIQISNLIKYADINDDAKVWADMILNWENEKISYNGLEKWDMNLIVHKLEELYMSLLGNSNN